MRGWNRTRGRIVAGSEIVALCAADTCARLGVRFNRTGGGRRRNGMVASILRWRDRRLGRSFWRLNQVCWLRVTAQHLDPNSSRCEQGDHRQETHGWRNRIDESRTGIRKRIRPRQNGRFASRNSALAARAAALQHVWLLGNRGMNWYRRLRAGVAKLRWIESILNSARYSRLCGSRGNRVGRRIWQSRKHGPARRIGKPPILVRPPAA